MLPYNCAQAGAATGGRQMTNIIVGNFRSQKKMALVNINYDEFKSGSYKAVLVQTLNGGDDVSFCSGNVIVDWANMLIYIKARYADFVFASSVERFIMGDRNYYG